jgi:hypothetical protein
VDEGLAVEAEGRSLGALGGEPLGVVDGVEDAVEDGLAGCTGGGQTRTEAPQQRRPTRHLGTAQFLGEVVRAHHGDGQPR